MTIQHLRNRKGVLIDTNLLVLYLIGLYDPQRIESNKRTRAYTSDDFYLLTNFLQLFKQAIITTNILTEVSNLLEGVSYQNGPVLAHLPEYLGTFKEVHLLGSAIMLNNRPLFVKFGLSDTTAYELAKQDYLVLTDDLDFCYFLQSNNLPALNFNNIRTINFLR